MAAAPVGAMEAYWQDDFKPLEAAGKAVLVALRADETASDADLYRRIISSGPGSHLYFDSKETMVHRRTVPLPPYLQQQLKSTRMAVLMGLFPEANFVWMTVDDKLFLWSSDIASGAPGGMEDFCSFAVPTGQCVVSVGLVKPKKGVFKDTVEWCLVVTTPEEVILCALARSNGEPGTSGQDLDGFLHGKGTLRLIPTRYVLPTDSVSLLSVCGTPDGRILLGGYDGCLYEMTYDPLTNPAIFKPTLEERLDQFYDEGKPFPEIGTTSDNSVGRELVLAGKRTIASVLPKSLTEGNPRKCRKLNHTSHASSIASAILPDFLTRAASAIFGSGASSTAGGPILKMVHDAERSCLYTLSTRGWICAFDLGKPSITQTSSNKTPEIKLMAVMDAEKTARLYLEAVSKGRMYPPSSTSATVGNITFPGGNSSAQAGVGGMDGARTILKLADSEKSAARRASRHDQVRGILTPVSLHVVSRRESGRLTLVAVTAGGLRYYLTSLSSNVLNAGPGQHMGTNRRTDPLAPSRKFTLCHVRSPPPVGETGLVQDLPSFDAQANAGVEGYVPRLVTRSGRIAQTDSAYYGDGVMVLAVEHKTNPQGSNGSTASRTSKFVGDVIVTAGPDSVARKKITTTSSTSTDGQGRDIMTAPGGISETLSLPMALDAPSASEQPPVLPGGRVLDINVTAEAENRVLQLAMRSQTPTDSEMNVGMVPAFAPNPPSASNTFVRSSDIPARAVVATRGQGDGTSILLTLLKNFLLSRPLREGLDYRSRASMRVEGGDSVHRANPYRISNSYGSSGFSTTAGGSAVTNKVSVGRNESFSTAKSVRLSPWLLRPAVVPLNPSALQHLMPSRDMVALNTGGLHFFTFKSVLANLAEALMAPGVNVTADKKVTEFFTSYGYPQGCAMCLSLAIGYGPKGTSDDYSAELESRARRAALSRAFLPKLVLQAAAQNGGAASDAIPSSGQSDTAVPAGYDFKPSALYEGVTSLVSRLLRPIWYKPAVVVTEGQKTKSIAGSETIYPAKVELLLDDATLEDVHRPLNALLSMMREVFSPAVDVVPGTLQQNEDRMDVDYSGDGSHNVVTGTMQYQRYIQNQNGFVAGAARGLTVRETVAIARLVEERNIHSLYRLLSRTVQLLRLLSSLQKAHYMPELCGVDWGMLHGLTVAQLATNREGQERIENLLNSLVSSNLSPSSVVRPSAQADQLANFLASECYLYFSPGSRFAYSGFRCANEALSCAPASARRTALANQAATELKQAARYWYSASLITGRVLHSIDTESYDQVARRAIQYDSPLAKAAAALMHLRDVSSLVDVCLTTASNFGGRHTTSVVPSVQKDETSRILPWERNLYHKRTQALAEARRVDSGSATPTPSSVVGADVTSKEALKTCHAIIFYHLTTLLGSSDSDLATKMVAACAASSDQNFKLALYEHLVKSHHEYALLQIRNTDLEKWLARPGGDKELLWRYYREQNKHTKAAEIMHRLASSDSKDISLEERISALTKSVQSYEEALRQSAEEMQTANGRRSELLERHEEIQRKVLAIEEQLEIAMLQNRVGQAVVSESLASKLSESQLDDLKGSLIPVSDLYNDYAAPLQLFDICILLLSSCGVNNPGAIQNLWQSLICEELLPCSTRSPDAYHYLRTLMAGSMLTQHVTLLSDDRDYPVALFENGNWVEGLKTRVIYLGRDLCRGGPSSAFPVDFLASTFEELRRAQLVASETGTVPAPWPLVIFAQVGVSYMDMFQVYDKMSEVEERELMGGVDADRRLYHLSSTTELMTRWVGTASSSSPGVVSGTEALRDLSRSSTFLLSRIDAYKATLERMRGAINGVSELIHQLVMVESAIQSLK